MRKMIRGKYDSLWKFDTKRQLRRGKFATAMQYACRVKGGVVAIQHIRNQPWETWQPLVDQ